MMQRGKTMPINNLRNSNVQSELLRQNWENARYHESSRWKYTYYYYAAFGAYVIYFLRAFESNQFKVTQFESIELFIFAFLYCILMLIGYASFYHLLYSNIEYKNYIRAVEYISRDLNLNQNITEFRKGDKEIDRSTYMALPLLLKIRKKMPFTMLTGAATAISGGASFFLFMIFLVKLCLKESCVEYFNTIISISFVSLLIFVLILWNMKRYWINTENAAELELDRRDPKKC
jgi:hypothetical protein